MKFHGTIGFWNGTKEVSPGVFQADIKEVEHYYGDIVKNVRKFRDSSEKQNDDLTLANQISIVSDLYLQQHWPSIAYVIWNDVAWKVSEVDIRFPRIILTIGGVYNGKRPVKSS